jgi:virulence-associated protein VapD
MNRKELEQLIDEIIKRQLIESPDDAILPGVTLQIGDSDSIPFSLSETSGKFFIGKKGQSHRQMFDDFSSVQRNTEDIGLSTTQGRIWLNKKVISFWKMKNTYTVKKTIDEINAQLKLDKRAFQISPNWNVDCCSYAAYRMRGLSNSSILKPLSQVMKEAPKGDCDNYTIEWGTVGSVSEGLNESPDSISKDVSNSDLRQRSADAISFSFDDKFKIAISKKGETHEDLFNKMNKGEIPRIGHVTSKTIQGRFWIKEEIISFWNIGGRPIKFAIDKLNAHLKLNKIKTQITTSWNVDCCSYIANKLRGIDDASILKPLSQVIKEAPFGDCDEYTVEWNTLF